MNFIMYGFEIIMKINKNIFCKVRFSALIIAGIIAKGSSKIYGLEHLDRGYENFESKLKILGIKVAREFKERTINKKEYKIDSEPEDIPKCRAA